VPTYTVPLMASANPDISASTAQPGQLEVSDEPMAYKSELLCFMQQKGNLMTFDHIVKLCADFYRKDEIVSARNIVDQFVSKRLARRQGNEALKCTIEDMLKIILDPAVKLPSFYAVDLCRLPPVEADHCDVSAILREVQALRYEVRLLGQLKDEVDKLKYEVQLLRQNNKSAYNMVDEFPLLSHGDTQNLANIDNLAAHSSAVECRTDVKSFVDHARNLQESGITMRKPRKQPVVGKSTKFQNIKAVITKRPVDVFVSRWNPNTTASEVTACVEDILQGNYSDGIECVRLTSRYEHLYASFFVSVTVPSSNMKDVIELLMSPDSWPDGLLVKRYFRPKHGRE